jgi:ParB-like chromosome segregation protein Spo0J
MESKRVKISEVKLNPNNPRLIKDDKFERLVQSIKDFPEMLNIRPIVVNKDMIILGGNMRFKACKEAGLKEIPIIVAKDLTQEQEREFLIKDNVSGGEWDWDILAEEWDVKQLDIWGLDMPKISETEKLSKLEFEDIYYEPKEIPDINLEKCIDKTKFEAKIKIINESGLSDEKKEILKLFAYKFLKIDFESVANYYYFNAGDEEQQIIERLRLVLCDSGLQGFIDDDLLRTHETLEGWQDSL